MKDYINALVIGFNVGVAILPGNRSLSALNWGLAAFFLALVIAERKS